MSQLELNNQQYIHEISQKGIPNEETIANIDDNRSQENILNNELKLNQVINTSIKEPKIPISFSKTTTSQSNNRTFEIHGRKYYLGPQYIRSIYFVFDEDQTKSNDYFAKEIYIENLDGIKQIEEIMSQNLPNFGKIYKIEINSEDMNKLPVKGYLIIKRYKFNLRSFLTYLDTKSLKELNLLNSIFQNTINSVQSLKHTKCVYPNLKPDNIFIEEGKAIFTDYFYEFILTNQSLNKKLNHRYQHDDIRQNLKDNLGIIPIQNSYLKYVEYSFTILFIDYYTKQYGLNIYKFDVENLQKGLEIINKELGEEFYDKVFKIIGPFCNQSEKNNQIDEIMDNQKNPESSIIQQNQLTIQNELNDPVVFSHRDEPIIPSQSKESAISSQLDESPLPSQSSESAIVSQPDEPAITNQPDESAQAMQPDESNDTCQSKVLNESNSSCLPNEWSNLIQSSNSNPVPLLTESTSLSQKNKSIILNIPNEPISTYESKIVSNQEIISLAIKESEEYECSKPDKFQNVAQSDLGSTDIDQSESQANESLEILPKDHEEDENNVHTQEQEQIKPIESSIIIPQEQNNSIEEQELHKSLRYCLELKKSNKLCSVSISNKQKALKLARISSPLKKSRNLPTEHDSILCQSTFQEYQDKPNETSLHVSSIINTVQCDESRIEFQPMNNNSKRIPLQKSTMPDSFKKNKIINSASKNRRKSNINPEVLKTIGNLPNDQNISIKQELLDYNNEITKSPSKVRFLDELDENREEELNHTKLIKVNNDENDNSNSKDALGNHNSYILYQMHSQIKHEQNAHEIESPSKMEKYSTRRKEKVFREHILELMMKNSRSKSNQRIRENIKKARELSPKKNQHEIPHQLNKVLNSSCYFEQSTIPTEESQLMTDQSQVLLYSNNNQKSKDNMKVNDNLINDLETKRSIVIQIYTANQEIKSSSSNADQLQHVDPNDTITQEDKKNTINIKNKENNHNKLNSIDKPIDNIFDNNCYIKEKVHPINDNDNRININDMLYKDDNNVELTIQNDYSNLDIIELDIKSYDKLSPKPIPYRFIKNYLYDLIMNNSIKITKENLIIKDPITKHNYYIISSNNASLIYYGHINNKGQKHGIGRCYYHNDEIYHGEFSNNLKNGIGIYYYSNNEHYEGKWLNDLRHGVGRLYDSNNKLKMSGTWEKDELNGNGIYYFENGEIYEGEFKGNKFHGTGILFHDNNCPSYEGTWENGMKNGKFLQFDRQGNLIRSCVFENGNEIYQEEDIQQLKSSLINLQEIEMDNTNISLFSCNTITDNFNISNDNNACKDIQKSNNNHSNRRLKHTIYGLMTNIANYYFEKLKKEHEELCLNRHNLENICYYLNPRFNKILFIEYDFLMKLTKNTLDVMNWDYQSIKSIHKRHSAKGFTIFDLYDRILFLIKDFNNNWFVAEINCKHDDKFVFCIYDSNKNPNYNYDISLVLRKFIESEIKEKCCSNSNDNKNGTDEYYNKYIKKLERSEYRRVDVAKQQNIEDSGVFAIGFLKDIVFYGDVHLKPYDIETLKTDIKSKMLLNYFCK